VIQPDEINALVQAAIPDAEVSAEDFTGTGDHFQVTVISSVFQGKTLIDQHRLVQQALKAALDDGRLHAVQIKTSAQRR
jgi:stress-induced morphogen